jgi:hypothetical protein
MLRTAASLMLPLLPPLLLACAKGVDDGNPQPASEVSPTVPAEQAPALASATPISAAIPPSPAKAKAAFDDQPGDATDIGADIRQITVAETPSRVLEVVVQNDGVGSVELFIDTDLVGTTGIDGYDARVTASAAGEVQLWFDEGGAWTAEDAPTFRGSYADGVLAVRIDRAYLGNRESRGPIGVAAIAENDRAPDGAPEDRFVYTPL